MVGKAPGLARRVTDTFAGFEVERAKGINVFTGERITSASARHILGEETCRVLRLLEPRDANTKAALERASSGLLGRLQQAAQDPRNTNPGRYCCGKCTVGLWRNLVVGGLDRQAERLQKGVKYLRSMRDGAGKWRVFPFWYTVLALSEIDLSEAIKELAYAAPILEHAASRPRVSTDYARRRQAVARRALTRI